MRQRLSCMGKNFRALAPEGQLWAQLWGKACEVPE